MSTDYFAHEALDRTHVILQMIGSHLMDHPYIADRPEHSRRVSEAFEALSSLYQDIGREHLSNGDEDAPVRIDIERMQRALAGATFTLPSGLTPEQIRQFIEDAAAGKIAADPLRGTDFPFCSPADMPPPTLETARRVMEEHADVLRALKDR